MHSPRSVVGGKAPPELNTLLHYYNLRIHPICPKICLFLQNKKFRRTFGAMARTCPLGSTSGKSWELIRIIITQLLLNTFETCHCVQSWTMYSIWNANTLSGMTYSNSSTSYNLTGSHWRIRYASAFVDHIRSGYLLTSNVVPKCIKITNLAKFL